MYSDVQSLYPGHGLSDGVIDFFLQYESSIVTVYSIPNPSMTQVSIVLHSVLLPAHTAAFLNILWYQEGYF